jgi:2-methylfumaryl-CoA isomerase
MTAALLDGLTVLEISSFVAAPLGGMTLAQLGADVIRIDPIGGAADQHRWPLAPSGASLYWAGLNKAKKSVTLNFRDPDGQRILTDLVAASGPGGGIVLTNAVGRPWLGHDQLARVRPDLIHLQIQGHHDGRPAVDYTVNAGIGFPLITGPEEYQAPVNHVLPAWDIACGLYAAIGLLSAERHRQRTGEGSRITLALEDVALALTGHLGFLAEAQLAGTDRPRIGNHLYGGFARDFATADGERVMVAAITARHFADLATATGLAGPFAELERLLGADFGTDGDRYAHREVIASLLAPWFAERDLADIGRQLAGASVLWSRYRRFTDLVGELTRDGDPARDGDLARDGELTRDGDLAGHPLIREIDQPGVGRVLAPGSPLVREDRPDPEPAPLLGADTAAVLAGLLGLSAQDISALADRGVAGCGAGGSPVTRPSP